MSKYGVFSGPYFSVFGLNTGKYGLEKTPYLDTFCTVIFFKIHIENGTNCCLNGRSFTIKKFPEKNY